MNALAKMEGLWLDNFYTVLWANRTIIKQFIGIILVKVICGYKHILLVTNALSTMLRLLGEESEAASWLMEARSRMDPIELYDKEW